MKSVCINFSWTPRGSRAVSCVAGVVCTAHKAVGENTGFSRSCCTGALRIQLIVNTLVFTKLSEYFSNVSLYHFDFVKLCILCDLVLQCVAWVSLLKNETKSIAYLRPPFYKLTQGIGKESSTWFSYRCQCRWRCRLRCRRRCRFRS